MKYTRTQTGYVLRLDRGEQLQLTLKQFIKDKDIRAGWVNALGAAEAVELGYFDLDKKDYIWRQMKETLEITTISGNIAWEDTFPIVHLHGSFSDKDMNGYGGHVKELTVAATCEVHIVELKPELKRSFDNVTGLHMLDIGQG